MLSLKDYIDHHASRFTATRSVRQIENLHALRNLAQWLYCIQQRRAMGQVYINGQWTAPQEKGR